MVGNVAPSSVVFTEISIDYPLVLSSTVIWLVTLETHTFDTICLLGHLFEISISNHSRLHFWQPSKQKPKMDSVLVSTNL